MNLEKTYNNLDEATYPKASVYFDKNYQLRILITTTEGVPPRERTLQQLGFTNLKSLLKHYGEIQKTNSN
jgi:hypothetical protein